MASLFPYTSGVDLTYVCNLGSSVFHQSINSPDLQIFTPVVRRLSGLMERILVSESAGCYSHNEHLRNLLRDALETLNDIGSDEEYHENLRVVMKIHTDLSASTLGEANVSLYYQQI